MWNLFVILLKLPDWVPGRHPPLRFLYTQSTASGQGTMEVPFAHQSEVRVRPVIFTREKLALFRFKLRFKWYQFLYFTWTYDSDFLQKVIKPFIWTLSSKFKTAGWIQLEISSTDILPLLSDKTPSFYSKYWSTKLWVFTAIKLEEI